MKCRAFAKPGKGRISQENSLLLTQMDTLMIKCEWWVGDRRGTGCKFQLFAKLMHRYRGFYSHLFFFLLFTCDFYRCLNTCTNNPPRFISSCLLYFGIATLQMELNAQVGEAPWRGALRRLSAHDGKKKKELTEKKNSAAHFFFS